MDAGFAVSAVRSATSAVGSGVSGPAHQNDDRQAIDRRHIVGTESRVSSARALTHHARVPVRALSPDGQHEPRPHAGRGPCWTAAEHVLRPGQPHPAVRCSHHFGGKFAGRGFTQGTPVRYTAKGQSAQFSPPSPSALSVESFPITYINPLPKLPPARTQKLSPLPRKVRVQGEAMYERNDFIQKSGFGIY